MRIKAIKCVFVGHVVDLSENIVADIIHDKRNWICKCHRCGLYLLHDGANSGMTVTISEKMARRVRKRIEHDIAYYKAKYDENKRRSIT